MSEPSEIAAKLRSALRSLNDALEEAFKADVEVSFKVTETILATRRVPLVHVDGEASRMKVEFSERI